MNDLRQIIVHRMQSHFNKNNFGFEKWVNTTFNGNLIQKDIARYLPELPDLDEWTTLVLSLVPHVQPDFFSTLISEHLPSGGDFPEFGGVKAGNHRGLLPTGETLQYILAGNDMENRLQVQQLFAEDHFFHRFSILWLEPVKEGEPVMSGRIVMGQDWVDKVLLDRETIPR